MRARTGSLIVTSLALLGAGAVVVACTIADSLRLPDAVADSGGPVVPDAADAAVVPVDPCRSDGLPLPPTQVVGSSGGATYYLTVDSLSFGGGDAGAVGLNLDQQCTCPDPGSCVPLGSTAYCDLPNGIDNAAGDLVNSPLISNGFDLKGFAQSSLARGQTGLLMKIDGYNGEANDSTVNLSFYVSDGPVTDDAGTGLGSTQPKFTPAELWSVDQGSIITSGDLSKYPTSATADAQVTNWTLVSRRLYGTMRFDLNWSLDAKGFTISGTLVKDPVTGLFRVEKGVMAGRWATSDALRNIGNLRDPQAQVDGGRVCQNPNSYLAVKNVVCSHADITASGLDNANVPCDALSIGMGFTAKPATFGPIVKVDTPLAACAEAGITYGCN